MVFVTSQRATKKYSKANFTTPSLCYKLITSTNTIIIGLFTLQLAAPLDHSWNRGKFKANVRAFCNVVTATALARMSKRMMGSKEIGAKYHTSGFTNGIWNVQINRILLQSGILLQSQKRIKSKICRKEISVNRFPGQNVSVNSVCNRPFSNPCLIQVPTCCAKNKKRETPSVFDMK